MSGWIGVDLDATLAHYEGWNDGKIGAPVPLMVERVLRWIEEGIEVRIFTARVSTHQSPETIKLVKEAIQQWLRENGLPKMAITCEKDFSMIELWDDRCRQVQPNTGMEVHQFWGHRL